MRRRLPPSCRDRSRSGRQRPPPPRAPPARPANIARPTQSYGYGDRSMPLRSGAAKRAVFARPRALPFAQRLVLVQQQIQMRALFVGELEEDSLAFRILEPLAVALEEVVRAALALDADQERFEVVDTF